MPCFSIVLWLRRLGKSAPKNGRRRCRQKFAPRCGARTIPKSKSLKRGMIGPLFEVQACKICTMLWRESDSEVNIVKARHDRSTFWSWSPENLHHAVARERLGSQNMSKPLKHQVLGTFLEFQIAFYVAGAGVSTEHPHKISLKRIVILRSRVWSTCHSSRMFHRKASVCQLVSLGWSVSRLVS